MFQIDSEFVNVVYHLTIMAIVGVVMNLDLKRQKMIRTSKQIQEFMNSVYDKEKYNNERWVAVEDIKKEINKRIRTEANINDLESNMLLSEIIGLLEAENENT